MSDLRTETPFHVMLQNVYVMCGTVRALQSSSLSILTPCKDRWLLAALWTVSHPSPAENIHFVFVPSLGEEQIFGTVTASSLCSDLMLGEQDKNGEGRLLF